MLLFFLSAVKWVGALPLSQNIFGKAWWRHNVHDCSATKSRYWLTSEVQHLLYILDCIFCFSAKVRRVIEQQTTSGRSNWHRYPHATKYFCMSKMLQFGFCFKHDRWLCVTLLQSRRKGFLQSLFANKHEWWFGRRASDISKRYLVKRGFH